MAVAGQLEVAVSTSGRSQPSWRGLWLPPGHHGHSLTFEVADLLGHFELVVLEKDLTRRVQTPAGGHCHRRNIPWPKTTNSGGMYQRRPPAAREGAPGRQGPGNTTRLFVTLKPCAP